jgi:squalene-hopene/tetraprenyl-beta-curcumene cyclase
VAVRAFREAGEPADEERIRRGLAWLAATATPDGGWGDTPDSPANLSTTALVYAALSGASEPDAERAAEAWLARAAGGLEPRQLAAAVLRAYGQDRTFSAPILATLALAGRLGPAEEAWGLVPQLPFEAAVLPHALFRWVRLRVVSYAIPALIAIGLVRHRHRAAHSLVTRVRDAMTPRALRVLERAQPSNGGFLEAVPLTAFVVMSLAGSGERGHPVVRRGLEFLRATAREDGSWPIDTGLPTWLTTLAVKALDEGRGEGKEARAEGEEEAGLTPAQCGAVRRWLLAQQYREVHPFTHAAPGGWSWTPLPGGVPDADDTAGALLALRRLGPVDAECRAAAEAGLRWLLGLQNRDGGIPTFCRGWGRLPFDRSCPDLTAHAWRAWREWKDDVAPALRRRLERGLYAAERYLLASQRPDGSWVPLWFGNQQTPGQENATYGTALVVEALSSTGGVRGSLLYADERGRQWLLATQNKDGGWGGGAHTPSTIEETALAVRALAAAGGGRAASRGAAWLAERTNGGRDFPASPIGLYFARLWYWERLYPLVFAVAGLRRQSAVAPAAALTS